MPDSRGPDHPDGPPEFGEDPERAEDELSSVVFDEHFVRAALIHEPTAAERLLSAAPQAPPGGDGVFPPQPGFDPLVHRAPGDLRGVKPRHVPNPPPGDEAGPPRTAWWRQSVAWVLALLMGIGVVAMAVTAVAPGRGGQGPSGPQPTLGTPVPQPGDRVPSPAASTPVNAAFVPVGCARSTTPRPDCG
ncbi:hypothetical protein [Yinghuangia seranimata]|uniref:SCO2584 family spore wall biosynthesis protein n=1 Tax=Yinghuangia seranimata TaxID=408067 RepID=UPI00248D23A2|nr:hypothetical protein [Yinghuangia seranimata]MDI2127406.1 hypothetical protein [Yinghuangia seranimata]